eukprot:11421815-Alexandrium_andersonii.AAC.1
MGPEAARCAGTRAPRAVAPEVPLSDEATAWMCPVVGCEHRLPKLSASSTRRLRNERFAVAHPELGKEEV